MEGMKITRGVLFFIVISIFFFPACEKFGKKRSVPGPDDKVYTVATAPVTEREVPDVIKLDGRFIPQTRLQIKSDFVGKVQTLSIEEGQEVLAGDVLLKIEDEKLPWVLERQRAGLREAEAQLEYDRTRGFAGGPEDALEEPEEEEEEEEEVIEETGEGEEVAEEEEAEEELEEGEEETPLARLARLRRRAQRARQAAQARLRRSQRQAPGPRASPEETRSRETLDQAKIDRLNAELALTEKQMEGSTIATSIDGFVTKLEVAEGSLVKPGDMLVEILTTDPIELSLKIPKEEIGRIDKKMTVKVIVPDLGNRNLAGEISFIGAELEEDQRTVEVRIRIGNPNHKIKVGMEGIAEMAVERASHLALLVPEDAVVRRDGLSYVYVVDGQLAQAREVDTGASVEGWMEIRRGLKKKDKVVTQGVDQLKEQREFIKSSA